MNAASPILFDLDGTLLDTHDMILESMQYTINEVDGQNQNDEKLMAGVGTPLLDQMLHFTAGNKTRAEELVNIYRAYNDAIHDENIHAFPGTKEALGMLAQAGCRMGVVTSKRHWLAQRGLEICGLDSFFEFLVGSDDWPEHKPAPARSFTGVNCSASRQHNALILAIVRSISRPQTQQDAKALQLCGACLLKKNLQLASLI